MEQDFFSFAGDAAADAGSFDKDDLFAFGSNYFSCGWSEKLYRNHSISIAIALIGSIYGDEAKGVSDYHKGVAFLSKGLKITKRQIKVLRKKMKGHGGFYFKTPFSIAEVVEKIISLLKDQESDPNVKIYLSVQMSKMYRDILIANQFEAIKEAAKKGQRKRIRNVADRLRNMTVKVGD